MPTPSPAPIRVAECGACGQLFAVYATAGEVACPACEISTEVESLEIVELGVAAPVEVRIEAPTVEPEPVATAPPRPEPSPPVELTAAVSPAAPQPVETKPAPTVAEWLLRSESPSPATVEPKRREATASESLAGGPKPSLAASLGWQPGSFNLDHAAVAADQHAGEPPKDEPTGETLDDFRFDFGATPLSEHAPNEDADAVSLEISEAADDRATPASLDALLSQERRPRRWAGPLSAVAGLLMVAAPAAYMVMTWPAEEGVAETALNDHRFAAEDEPITPASNHSAEVASPKPPADEPPAPYAAADPIIDTATRPASFNRGADDEPKFDLPPNAPTTTSLPPESTVKTSETSADDPFLAPPPTAQPATAQPPQDRYATPAGPPGDRYASLPGAAEPESFELPEDKFNQIDESPAPVPLPTSPEQVGLLNAPRYGRAELLEAFNPAEDAARGFAEGTLADPEQVSTMGQHYARLCYLAQVLTLIDPSADDPNLLTTELQAADTFKRLFREERARVESRQIAGAWIAWSSRPHGGVFFSGLPGEIRPAGKAIEYEFTVGDTTVPVVMATRIDADRLVNANAKEIGVIGVVVENPREWIAGYEGDSERVVWARKTLALPRASDL